MINSVVVELLTALTEYHSVCNVSSTLILLCTNKKHCMHFGHRFLYSVVDDKPFVRLYTEIGTHNMNTEMIPVSCTGS